MNTKLVLMTNLFFAITFAANGHPLPAQKFTGVVEPAQPSIRSTRDDEAKIREAYRPSTSDDHEMRIKKEIVRTISLELAEKRRRSEQGQDSLDNFF